jgi:4-hydroxy-3-methylbut-2-en-1-yl diphosphate reductase
MTAGGVPRTVLLAGPRSFCAGVDRAIAIVERALERHGSPVYVRRQIVHNLHVIRDLEARGAVFVEELDEVPDGAVTVLAAHGVAPTVRAEADERGLRVIDATCPLVAKVHTEARSFARRDYDIVLIGHADHEEVEGTVGEAPDRIQIVDGPDDVSRLRVRNPEKVAYLTQTTLAVDDVADIVEALRTRFPNVTGPRADDICYATQNRQEAVRAIVGECDLVLVVGSRNSSNSNRLAEVARRSGTPAVLIEDASELDPELVAGATTIGLTAGASAPESLVEGVIAALGELGPVIVEHRPVLVEDVHFALPAEVR